METDFLSICDDSLQFDFLLGWTLFKELSMRNACDTAPLMHKLIVYGNGVANPPLTKPHGMKYIPWGKNDDRE